MSQLIVCSWATVPDYKFLLLSTNTQNTQAVNDANNINVSANNNLPVEKLMYQPTI